MLLLTAEDSVPPLLCVNGDREPLELLVERLTHTYEGLILLLLKSPPGTGLVTWTTTSTLSRLREEFQSVPRAFCLEETNCKCQAVHCSGKI